jgi:hypothetical protein
MQSADKFYSHHPTLPSLSIINFGEIYVHIIAINNNKSVPKARELLATGDWMSPSLALPSRLFYLFNEFMQKPAKKP